MKYSAWTTGFIVIVFMSMVWHAESKEIPHLNEPGGEPANKSSEQACEEISENKPPDMVVIFDKPDQADMERGEDETSFPLPSPSFEVNQEETGDDEKAMANVGMTIICAADYPVRLEFQLNDEVCGYLLIEFFAFALQNNNNSFPN